MESGQIWSKRNRDSATELIERAMHAREVALRQWIDALRYARASGMTLDAIADLCGLTRQRVWQILKEQDS